MGRITHLAARSLSLGTGNVLAGFQSAAAGSAAQICRILEIIITQSATATGAMVDGAISTRDTAGTLTTTSTTPKNAEVPAGAASGLTGNTNILGGTARSGTNSSADSGGTYTDQDYFSFSNLNGMPFIFTPKGEIFVPPSTVWVVRFMATPGTTTGWGVRVKIEEM